MTPIRLLMLNYEYPPIGGGAGRAHENLLRQYAQRDDLEVDVLTSCPTPGFELETPAANVRLHKVGLHKKHLRHWRQSEVLEWFAKSLPRYWRMLRANRYDLVHAFFGFPSGWLCYRSRRKLPYVISLRGSDVPGHNSRLRRQYQLLGGLFARIWDNAAVVVANSRGLRERAVSFRPHLDIPVIPNGVDTRRFVPASSAGLKSPVRLLAVARLSTNKRLDLLIGAVAALQARERPARLTLVGEGVQEAPLKSLCEELGVAEQVSFPGQVVSEKMPKVYREHDIFMLCSEHEGMSNAMLEAMASGLPVVTTACEGVHELLDNNGAIAESPDHVALAEAVQHVCADPARYDRMRQASRRRSESFSWAATADQYIGLYRAILNSRHEARSE